MKKTILAPMAIISILSILSAKSANAILDTKTAPMDRERLISILQTNPEITTLDQLPAKLPDTFLLNFILKHGTIKRVDETDLLGERGHLIEKKVSQSSDPLAPRAIIWDERTGFSVSYNGGTEGQTAGQRLDILNFNLEKKTFLLEQIDFPIAPGAPKIHTTDCASCHGRHHRPIFSMYPDWPAFYGSDNDELTGSSSVQKREREDYQKFRTTVADHHPRYLPLYSDARVRKYLGVGMYPSFPYRPNVSGDLNNVSRSFQFRPELRMGILYNRLINSFLTSLARLGSGIGLPISG